MLKQRLTDIHLSTASEFPEVRTVQQNRATRAITSQCFALVVAVVLAVSQATHAVADSRTHMPVPVSVGAASTIRPLATISPPSCSTPSLPAAVPNEFVELARALKYDPKLIFQYVHDNIEFSGVFGSMKGPLGTLLDGRGGAFDQAELLVAVLVQAQLHNSGITAINYQYGTLHLTGTQFAQWLNTDTDLNSISFALQLGSYPDQYGFTNPSTSGNTLLSADVPHVWVQVVVNGTTYAFDPAFKAHTTIAGVNIGSIIGYSRSTFFSHAEQGIGTNTPHEIQGLNRSNVRSDLAGFTQALANYLSQNLPGAGVANVVGGYAITPVNLATVGPTNPNQKSGSSITTWSAASGIPSSYRAVLSLGLQKTGFGSGGCINLNSDTVYEHRLSVIFVGSNVPELLFDGNTSQPLQTGTSAGSVGSPVNIATTVTLPWSSVQTWSGPQFHTVASGSTYVVESAWDEVGPATIEKQRQILTLNSAGGANPASEPVLGQNLALLGYYWVSERASQMQLEDQVYGTRSAYLYSVGIAGYAIGSGTPPTQSAYVDMRINQISSSVRTNGSGGTATSLATAAFFDFSGMGSGFEAGILRQNQGQNSSFVAASTTDLVDLANIQGQPIFLFDSTNATTVGSTLQNYGSSTITSIQNFAAGANHEVVAPQNGAMAVGNWTGGGFKEIAVLSNGSGSIGEEISGALSGGFGGTNTTTTQLNAGGQNQGTPSSSWASNVLGYLRQGFSSAANTVGDPVDRHTGSLMYQHDDLTMGSQPYPYGLGFQRTYSSSAAAISGPFGANGWTHNFAYTAQANSDGFGGLGADSPRAAAAAIVALFISSDILKSQIGTGTVPTLEGMVISITVNQWLIDQLVQNVVVVSQPTLVEHFAKLTTAAGTFTYAPPLGSASKLVQNADSSYTYTAKDQTALYFDTSGRLMTWKSAAAAMGGSGPVVTLSYNAAGQLATIANNMGRSLTLTYSGIQLQSVADNASPSRSVTYQYDTNGNLSQFTDTLGQATTFVYDTAGTYSNAVSHLKQIFTPTHPQSLGGPAFVTSSYDSLGRVSQQQDANGNTTLVYLAGTRTELDDPVGNQHVWYLDARGNTLSDTDGAGQTANYAYDGANDLTSATLPEGNSTTYTYDVSGNVLTETQTPKAGSGLTSRSRTYTYDPVFNEVTTATDFSGNATTYTYNGTTGTLATLCRPIPATGQTQPCFSYGYNSLGLRTSETDPTGRITAYSYGSGINAADLTTIVVDSTRLNLSTGFGYDAVGNRTSTTDGNGNTSTYQFDKNRRLTLVTPPSPLSASTTAYTYDPDGRVLSVSRATGETATPFQIWQYTYTPSGRKKTATDPLANAITYAYDADDRLASITDPDSRVTNYTYDPDSRLYQISIPLLSYTDSRTYHPNGTLATIVDGNANTTAYNYDGFDRSSQIVFADSSSQTFAYGGNFASGSGGAADSDDDLTTMHTRANEVVTWSYDLLHRPVQKVGDGTLTYTYDSVGRLVTAQMSAGSTQTPAGTWTRYYDTAGRHSADRLPVGLFVFYGWDNANNRSVLSWHDGVCAVTSYDQLNRPTVNLLSGSLSPCGNWSLMWLNSYDQTGRLFSQATGNGGGTGYTFAEPDVLVSGVVNLLQPNGSGGYNWQAANGYGYTKERQENSRTTTGMALLAHPAAAGTVAYLTPNNINQIPGISGGAAFSYNVNGNLTSDGVRAYTYDKQGDGHIVSATSTGVNTTYAYDPFGQRFSKTDNTQTPAVTTYYAHDDRGNEIGEYDGNWHLIRRLVYDQVHAAPVAMITAAGAITYNYFDKLGSVVAIGDATSNPVAQYAYLPYGDSNPPNIAACRSGTCGSGTGTSFGFAGYRYDPETGLYHAGARYYDPRLGRFLQPDPIGQAAGLNLYAYVGNDLLNLTDSSGLLAGQVGSTAYGLLPSRNTITGAGDVALGSVLVGLGGVEGFGAAVTSETGVGAVVLGGGAVLTVGTGIASINQGLVLMNQINQGQQDKHIEGTNNYDPNRGRSILTDPDPQALLDEYGGSGTPANNVPRGQPGFKERVDFGKVIGNYIDPNTGAATPTTRGMIVYGKGGAHIYPVRP